MNTIPFQNTYFARLVDFPVVVCRECQYSVWPSQIEGHLQRAHSYISPAVRIQLGDEVRSWPDLAIDPIELEIPPTRTHVIPQLVGPLDGWQCQLSPESCWYVCPSIDTMRQHWLKQHGWSRTAHKGQPTQSTMQTILARQEQACRQVRCQRIFPRKMGSQYFAIIDDKEDSHPIPTASRSTIWEQASRQYAEYEKQAAERIQQGHVDEANPWLRRTGWVPYLHSFSSTQLLEYIDMPAMDDQIDQSPIADPNERAIQAIWTAMGQVGQISQQSVIHTGVFVRMEAIRTERHQTRYQPLEAYQDPETMTERVRPWQQMLMFFWRTQQCCSSPDPTPESQTVHSIATRSAAPMGTQPIAHIQRVVPLRRRIIHRRDEMDEEIHHDPELESSIPAGSIPESSIPPLTPIQRACLDFCIELLNQRVVHREYDCALVCAMAVLGVRDRGGWRTPEDYPPILSKVIKLARFMVVRKAMELAENEDDADPASSMQENDWDIFYVIRFTLTFSRSVTLRELYFYYRDLYSVLPLHSSFPFYLRTTMADNDHPMPQADISALLIGDGHPDVAQLARAVLQLQTTIAEQRNSTEEVKNAVVDAIRSIVTESGGIRVNHTESKAEKVPNPDKFSGDRLKVDTFIAQLKNKFTADADKFPSERHMLSHAYALLDRNAATRMTPFMNATNDSRFTKMKEFYDLLERSFGITNKHEYALEQLKQLKQKNQEFVVYLSEFENLIASLTAQPGLPATYHDLVTLLSKLDSNIRLIKSLNGDTFSGGRSSGNNGSSQRNSRNSGNSSNRNAGSQAAPRPTPQSSTPALPAGEPMDIDATKQAERQHCCEQGLCYYCGSKDHLNGYAFMDNSFARKNNLQTFPLHDPRALRMFNGEVPKDSIVREVAQIRLKIGNHYENTFCFLTQLGLDHPLGSGHNDLIGQRISPPARGEIPANQDSRNSASMDPRTPLQINFVNAAALHTIIRRTKDDLELCRVTLPDIEKTLKKLENKEPPPDLRSLIPECYHDLIDVFKAELSEVLPPYRPHDHQIELIEGKQPPVHPLRRYSADELRLIQAWLKSNLNKYFIRPSNSAAAAPILLARKPGGGVRICVDYRGLNEITKKNRYPIPLIQETLQMLTRACYFMKLDIIAAFNKLRITAGDEWKTAFQLHQ
uniref:Transposon Tf2-6 polyprotein n=1 Tax=Talaromyces marneffei PM1 TaxID=1077442 RepID=A0A093UT40_TALMA